MSSLVLTQQYDQQENVIINEITKHDGADWGTTSAAANERLVLTQTEFINA